MLQIYIHFLMLHSNAVSNACRARGVQALTRVNPAVYESVADLAADPASAVIIFSGSDKVSNCVLLFQLWSS